MRTLSIFEDFLFCCFSRTVKLSNDQTMSTQVNLKNLIAIPYESYNDSIFIQREDESILQSMIKEFNAMEGDDEHVPMMTIDHCPKIYNRQKLITPKPESEWIRYPQHFHQDLSYNGYRISNQSMLTKQQTQIELWKNWKSVLNGDKWKQNNQLNELQTMYKSISQTIQGSDFDYHSSLINEAQINKVFEYNINYIDSLQGTTNSWISKNNNNSSSLINCNEFQSLYPQQSFGLGEEIFTSIKQNFSQSSFDKESFSKGSIWECGSSIQCMEPGYVQCFDRTPMDMWSMHIQISGARLLFSTSQLSPDNTKTVYQAFGHSKQCPYSAMHQQNIFPDNLSYLCESLRNGLKLYVTVSLPGTITIIKGGTLTFSLSMCNHETWTQSILFAPMDADTIENCQQSLKSYQANFKSDPISNMPLPEKPPHGKLECNTNYYYCNNAQWIGDEICHDLSINKKNSKKFKQNFNKMHNKSLKESEEQKTQQKQAKNNRLSLINENNNNQRDVFDQVMLYKFVYVYITYYIIIKFMCIIFSNKNVIIWWIY